MSHWSDSPEALRRLAAAYALGTLAGPARRRFEAVMAREPLAAAAVAAWNQRFAPLAERLPPAPARPALWSRIEAAAFADAPAAALDVPPSAASPSSTAVAPAPAPGLAAVPPAERARPALAAPLQRPASTAPGLADRLRGWFDVLLAPVPAAALAAGFALGLVLPAVGPLLQGQQQDTELPESYVGVLATSEGRTGMIVSSLRRGLVVDIKRVAAVPVPPGRELLLWVIDAQGRSTPVAAVPEGPFVRVKLDAPAEQVFSQAVELGLSLEAVGARPASPERYVYRGLCGKLWRVPPAR